MSFKLNKAVNPDRVFITRRSEMASRLDPFFYIPSVVALEKRVAAAGAKPLRTFVRSIAGGATPAKTDAAQYYTDEKQGVPFVRVQNLNTTSDLSLDDCIFITRKTHNEMLARSQVVGGDLLIKITGVGRMAVASVAPDGFDGNINQHIVVCKTGDHKASEALAAYLNLDFVERLAFRRATGGTRPALDYPALLSIPVILDQRVPELSRMATSEYLRMEAQARQLLASIDDLLLSELGIKLPPEPPATLKNRVFTRPFSELTGRRFDPSSHSRNLDLTGGKFPAFPVTKVARLNPRTDFSHLETAPISFVPMEAVSDDLGEADCSATRPADAAKSYTPFQEGDVISAKITPCMENGKAAVLRGLVGGYGYGSTEYHVFRPDPTRLNAEYLHALLRLQTLRSHARLFFTGSAGHQRVSEEFFYRLQIPVPPLKTQERIVEKIAARRDEAKRLRAAAAAQLATAKLEIEAMILG